MLLLCRRLRGSSSSKLKEMEWNPLEFVVGKFHDDLQLGVVLETCSYCHGFPHGEVLTVSPERELAERGTSKDFVGHRIDGKGTLIDGHGLREWLLAYRERRRLRLR
jgi:hypothetical protein